MGQKRKQDQADGDAVHASRQHQVPGARPHAFKKQRRSTPQDLTNANKSINALKKRVRDISRRLERVQDLPATVRVENERALAAYEAELAAALADKLRKKMIEKYHMVRFFERQKAMRVVKKLQKRIVAASTTDEVDQLKPLLQIAEVDVNYTRFYPLIEPYISLFPKDPKNPKDPGSILLDDANADEIRKSKPAMWTEVEKCMEAGTLQQLRDRKSTVNVPAYNKQKALKNPKSNPSKATSRKNEEAVERTESEDDGDVSDGGFFEE